MWKLEVTIEETNHDILFPTEDAALFAAKALRASPSVTSTTVLPLEDELILELRIVVKSCFSTQTVLDKVMKHLQIESNNFVTLVEVESAKPSNS